MSPSYVLKCHDPWCGWYIQLPPPTHPDKTRHQPWWPVDGLPRNFLCPQCRRIAQYESSSVRLVSAGRSDQNLNQKRNNVAYVEIQCEESGRVIRTRFHLFMANSEEMIQAAMVELHRATFHHMPCGNGFLDGDLTPDMVRYIDWSEDWERTIP